MQPTNYPRLRQYLLLWYFVTAALLLLGIAPGLQGHLRTMFASLALMSCTAWLFYSLVIINNKIDKE